jgi:hypothetical protein
MAIQDSVTLTKLSIRFHFYDQDDHAALWFESDCGRYILDITYTETGGAGGFEAELILQDGDGASICAELASLFQPIDTKYCLEQGPCAETLRDRFFYDREETTTFV